MSQTEMAAEKWNLISLLHTFCMCNWFVSLLCLQITRWSQRIPLTTMSSLSRSKPSPAQNTLRIPTARKWPHPSLLPHRATSECYTLKHANVDFAYILWELQQRIASYIKNSWKRVSALKQVTACHFGGCMLLTLEHLRWRPFRVNTVHLLVKSSY